PSVDQTSVNSSATTDSRVPEDSSTFQDGRVLNWLGVSVNHQVDYGRWSEQEASLHINVLELLGILKGLQTFASRLQGRNVIICGDITTSLAYIRKMGGTKSPIMSEMTVNIWELAQKYHINLIVEHVPGELKQEADHLSRLFQSDKQKPWSGDSTRTSSTGFSLYVVRWG
ncbi:MAG: reverse transcriptase-like protein, partial [Planctomycetes bacterium]|nr:reverse transcriptase-like protein [Planctomycetota bacterium]